MSTLFDWVYSDVDIFRTNWRKALKFELAVQNSTLFHVVQNKRSLAMVKGAKICHIEGVTGV